MAGNSNCSKCFSDYSSIPDCAEDPVEAVVDGHVDAELDRGDGQEDSGLGQLAALGPDQQDRGQGGVAIALAPAQREDRLLVLARPSHVDLAHVARDVVVVEAVARQPLVAVVDRPLRERGNVFFFFFCTNVCRITYGRNYLRNKNTKKKLVMKPTQSKMDRKRLVFVLISVDIL